MWDSPSVVAGEEGRSSPVPNDLRGRRPHHSGAGLLRPVIPATCATVSLDTGTAAPVKTVSDSESGGRSHSGCFPACRLPPRPTRFVLPTSRKPSLLEAGGSTSKDAEERDYVHDALHKVSRQVVEWISQLTDPVIVFEDLKDMRESIDYGTRLNRRLHSLPFATLQEMVSYKAAWDAIPSDVVDPEYTSQRCPRTECQHTERANRRKKRFKCCECEFQDHADRKAAVCVVQNWFDREIGNVPSLETLPRVRTVRRAASGRGGATDSHGHDLGSGVDRHGTSAQLEMEAQEELKSVASAVQD